MAKSISSFCTHIRSKAECTGWSIKATMVEDEGAMTDELYEVITVLVHPEGPTPTLEDIRQVYTGMGIDYSPVVL